MTKITHWVTQIPPQIVQITNWMTKSLFQPSNQKSWSNHKIVLKHSADANYDVLHQNCSFMASNLSFGI
jgi:hypothetical protein